VLLSETALDVTGQLRRFQLITRMEETWADTCRVENAATKSIIYFFNDLYLTCDSFPRKIKCAGFQ